MLGGQRVIRRSLTKLALRRALQDTVRPGYPPGRSSPAHPYQFDPDVGRYVLLTGIPLLVAMLVCVPVGVLSDRYGAWLTFPAVTLVAAASAFGLAMADWLLVRKVSTRA